MSTRLIGQIMNYEQIKKEITQLTNIKALSDEHRQYLLGSMYAYFDVISYCLPSNNINEIALTIETWEKNNPLTGKHDFAEVYQKVS